MERETGEQIQVGFGELPTEAINELQLDVAFTKQDFENALSRVFPFTQELQADQE